MSGAEDPTGPDAVVPLFPLGLVLVPGRVLPLHIFEPRYRRMLADLLALPEDERVFAVVAIREGHEVGEDAVRSIYRVGCTARLIEVERHDDGTYDLIATGDRRFDLGEVGTAMPYATAEVIWRPERGGPDDDLLALLVADAFGHYRLAQARSGVGIPVPDEIPDDPAVLSHLVTSAMVLDLSERQAMMEIDDTTERLRALLRSLRRETAFAAVLPSIPAGDLARTATSPN